MVRKVQQYAADEIKAEDLNEAGAGVSISTSEGESKVRDSDHGDSLSYANEDFHSKTRALLVSSDPYEEASLTAAYLDEQERDEHAIDLQEVSGYGGSIPHNISFASPSVHIVALVILETIEAIMAAKDLRPSRKA